MYLGRRCKPILIALGFACLQHAMAQAPETTSIPSAQLLPAAQVQVFGMVGVSTGQTIRLNVLNPGIITSSADPVGCTAQLFFFNDQGTVLKRATLTVSPRRSVSLEMNLDTDPAASGSRVEIRALVSALPLALQPSPLFCTLVPTVEIVDHDTGRTMVILTETRTFISIAGID